ncbi:hypothetical protein fHeYen902_188 [Yersinia phage fHe-Yen9-02]|nr:hypothetical protein fHeYen902_188 [Yersinia phage fHe-Yen9-02]
MVFGNLIIDNKKVLAALIEDASSSKKKSRDKARTALRNLLSILPYTNCIRVPDYLLLPSSGEELMNQDRPVALQALADAGFKFNGSSITVHRPAKVVPVFSGENKSLIAPVLNMSISLMDACADMDLGIWTDVGHAPMSKDVDEATAETIAQSIRTLCIERGLPVVLPEIVEHLNNCHGTALVILHIEKPKDEIECDCEYITSYLTPLTGTPFSDKYLSRILDMEVAARVSRVTDDKNGFVVRIHTTTLGNDVELELNGYQYPTSNNEEYDDIFCAYAVSCGFSTQVKELSDVEQIVLTAQLIEAYNPIIGIA